jgi:hypothetical protein
LQSIAISLTKLPWCFKGSVVVDGPHGRADAGIATRQFGPQPVPVGIGPVSGGKQGGCDVALNTGLFFKVCAVSFDVADGADVLPAVFCRTGWRFGVGFQWNVRFGKAATAKQI